MVVARISLLFSFLFACVMIHAQDTLDSIARIQPVDQVAEIELTFLLMGVDYNQVDSACITNLTDFSFRNTYYPKVEQLAESGNAAAQNLLGQCYLDGLGINKDPQKAFFWFSRAAEQMNHKALNSLGYCYENGIGTSRDEFQAYSFYKIAALKGHSAAFNNLANCYLDGIGTAVDSLKARAWFEKGAESGIRYSQTNVGYLYLYISGHEDYNKAFFWLSKAAEQDSPYALISLGFCYEKGWGVKPDHQKSQECYKKAYDLGLEKAKDFFD